MGAYVAMSIAMHRPDVFSAVFAMSPVHTEDPNPLGEMGVAAAMAADIEVLASASIPARVRWSKAAAFSPAPGGPSPFAVLPFGRGGGIDEVWQQWLRATLNRQVADHADALRRLALRVEVGTHDALGPEVERLSLELTALKIPHECTRFEGGHTAGVRARIETSLLSYFSRVLVPRVGSPSRTEDAAAVCSGVRTPGQPLTRHHGRH